MKYIFSGIFLYFFFGFFLYFFQRKIIFNTSKKPKPPSFYELNNVKEVFIPTTDKINLLAWHYDGHESNPMLVYFHGNSFDIGERAYRIKKYINANWSVLLLAWRGFSGNDGNPSEKNLYIDGESALKWILKNTRYKFTDLVIYGESLGTGVAVELSTRYKFLSTVLEAPFISIPAIAKKRYKIYPTRYLVKDKFDNLNKIDKINSPLLIISGKQDEIVPHSHSDILFKKAKVLKESVYIDEAMHNDLYDFGIEKSVISFNLKLWK